MRYKLIIGLGNPGEEYENTYHNAGLLALDALKEKLDAGGTTPVEFKKYKDLFEYAKYGDPENTALVRPLVFMNESGIALKEAARMAGASPEDIFVMHDDSDLAIGDVKISKGQGAAGHHGVESIVAALHSNDFTRARIGIRPLEEIRDRAGGKKAGEFVLQKIKTKDAKALSVVFEKIIERASLAE